MLQSSVDVTSMTVRVAAETWFCTRTRTDLPQAPVTNPNRGRWQQAHPPGIQTKLTRVAAHRMQTHGRPGEWFGQRLVFAAACGSSRTLALLQLCGRNATFRQGVAQTRLVPILLAWRTARDYEPLTRLQKR